MKVLGFLIAFLAVATYALPVEDTYAYYAPGEDPVAAFEKYIREALENFREQMKEGIPAIKMPIVEPLHLKDQKVQVNQDHVDLDLKLHEIVVEGLSGFEVLELSPDLPNLSIKAVFRFPRVSITGSYDVKGKVMKFIPIYGDGKYNVTVLGAELGGATSLILGEEDMEMTEPTLHIKWDKINLDLGNFLGGGSFGDTIQKMLSTLGKTLFEQFKPTILKKASEAISKEANVALNTDAVRQIVGKIIQGMSGRS